MIASLLKYYRVCILAVVALLGAGTSSYLGLPRAEDPEFDAARSSVVTLWPGVAASKIEDLVTRPLEEGIDELDNIRLLESTSSSGLSLIEIEIAPSGDPAEVIDEIERKVTELRSTLPDGVSTPKVWNFNTARNAISRYCPSNGSGFG